MFRLAILMLLCILNVLTLSLGQESLSFSKDDWQVDCDNTRTCRATGYVNDNDVNFDDVGASIMLIIEPGKDSKIYGFARTIEDYEHPLTLYINDQSFGQLQSKGASVEGELLLLGAQVDRLLNSKTINSIELKNKNNTLQVSSKGMTAVFLKIDEFQNRLNTPLALVKKGNQSVDQLKPYVDPPVIKVGKVIQDRSVIDSVTKNIAKFYPYFEKQFDIDSVVDSECWANTREDIDEIKTSIQIYSLNENKSLISHRCWRAAYNEADMYWLVDKSLDHIECVEGTYTSFEDGFLELFMKARGIGDCLYFERAAWDGKSFQMIGQENTGMCRGAVGGFWNIPQYVTEVIPYTEK